LHIPIQSGSNKVLKDMQRKYNVNDFKKIIKAFRKEIPNLSVATDIIVGYPTETEKDFKETLNLLKEIKPEVLNVSKFSSIQKTKASKLKQLTSQVIKERSVKINQLFQ
ncbi:MAG: radical SAM protein, partial [Nanoarchaeota archaeon]|nr:radical SAM protein [Nanoarchaeota archaeon]